MSHCAVVYCAKKVTVMCYNVLHGSLYCTKLYYMGHCTVLYFMGHYTVVYYMGISTVLSYMGQNCRLRRRQLPGLAAHPVSCGAL